VAVPGSLGGPSSAVRPWDGAKDVQVPRDTMGTCIYCLWFLLLCKFSVAIPRRKLYAPDGLTHTLHLFAVTEVAHVCHDHAGRGTWGGEVDMCKSSREAAIPMKVRFCTSRLAGETCCGLLQQLAHKWIFIRSEAGQSWGWLDVYSWTRSHRALGILGLPGVCSGATFLSKSGQLFNSSSVL